MKDDSLDRRVLENDSPQRLLALCHAGKGDRLRRFGHAHDHPVSCTGRSPLCDDIENDRQTSVPTATRSVAV